MAKASGDKAKPAKDKEKERLSKEAAIKDSREKRSEARAAASSLKDGLGAAAVAGAAAAASIREGSKSKTDPPVASPPRKERSGGEKRSVEPDSPALSRRRVRRGDPVQSSEEEAQGSEQSVPASESEDEEVTSAAKVSAGKKLMHKANIKVDFNAALLDFTF
jgi:hypothetical protein